MDGIKESAKDLSPVSIQTLGEFHKAKSFALLSHSVLGHVAVIDGTILLEVRLQTIDVLEALQ